MKTATVRDLRNKSAELLSWVQAGEEVTISKRGQIIARLIPERAENSSSVDWSQSAAVRMDRRGMTLLTQEQVREILSENQGHW